MSAGLGWFAHVVGAPRQPGVVASVTASRLGLIEYAAVPPAGRVSPVDSTDADASPAGRSLLCLVLPAPRPAAASAIGKPSWHGLGDLPHCGDLDRDFSGGLVAIDGTCA